MMRRAALLSGLALLALLWGGPLPGMTKHSFSAHMALHMGVVAVAAPLLAAGIAGAPGDPVRRAPRLFAPIPASFLELAVVWAWHAPALHHAARGSGAVMAIEQGTFLATGLLLWLAAVGGGPELRENRRGAGIIALLLTSMHMTLLGALLALAPRALYAHSMSGVGLAPLEDQHLGGAIMLLVGGVSYLAGGLWLTVGLLRSRGLIGGRA
jgi:putative membrane protein